MGAEGGESVGEEGVEYGDGSLGGYISRRERERGAFFAFLLSAFCFGDLLFL